MSEGSLPRKPAEYEQVDPFKVYLICSFSGINLCILALIEKGGNIYNQVFISEKSIQYLKMFKESNGARPTSYSTSIFGVNAKLSFVHFFSFYATG